MASTFSDVINPIRIYLGEEKPEILGRTEISDGSALERWLIRGSEIVLHILPDGRWTVFVPVSASPVATAQISALERFLQGRRADLEMILDIGNIARTFLDKISELPACSDKACTQKTCTENHALRQTIESFIARLFPSTKTQGVKNVRH